MYRHRTRGRPSKKRLLCDPWLWPRALRSVSGPRRRSGRSVIDREMAYVLIEKVYCQGSRGSQLAVYNGEWQKGVFAESPEIGPSQNTLEDSGSKCDALRVTKSLLRAVVTFILRAQRKWCNPANIRTYLYHTITHAILFTSFVQPVT